MVVYSATRTRLVFSEHVPRIIVTLTKKEVFRYNTRKDISIFAAQLNAGMWRMLWRTKPHIHSCRVYICTYSLVGNDLLHTFEIECDIVTRFARHTLYRR